MDIESITREGELLVSYAEHILRFAPEASEVLSNKNLIADIIAIGASETFGVVRIPDMLKNFRANFPGVKLNLSFSSVKSIYEHLQKNTIKANGLSPHHYLDHILGDLPGLPFRQYPEILDSYLPWHPDIQKKCASSKTGK